jgi:hypothetical protein
MVKGTIFLFTFTPTIGNLNWHKMKKTHLFITGWIIFHLVACGSGTNTEQTTSSGEQVASGNSVEMDPISQELMQQVVGQYGSKAGEQLRLEELLSQLKESELAHKGDEKEVLFGHWVGAFGKNKINITVVAIEPIGADNAIAYGYSVCAGNFRALTGTYNAKGNQIYSFVLNEPGDDPYDGKFEFEINTGQGTLVGNWTPFIAKGNSPKKYNLTKKVYSYDATIGDFPEASQRLLTADEVSFYYPEDLTYMRNEIYARHGYSFKNKDMRYFFEAQGWYVPMGVDIRYNLTPIEIANIGLIYEYETYYEDYYDGYGR